MKRKSDYPLITVMATSYNTTAFIKKFMKSVMKTAYSNFEVVIIDDHSTDGSYEWLINEYKNNSQIRVIRNETNLRLGKSRTKGIKLARGEYIAIMDVDTQVGPEWLKEAVKSFQGNESISAIQTVVYDLIKTKIIACGGLRIIPGLGWVIMNNFGRKKVKQEKNLYEVFPGITGIIYKKEVFKRIGYFDTQIGFNIDDVDFGLRFALAGFRCFVNPKAISYHMTFKTKNEREKGIKRLEWEFQFMKMPRIFIKNYEAYHIVLYLPVLLTIYFIRSFSWIVRGDVRPFIAFCWSIVWHVRNLPDNLRERRKVQNLRKISDNEMFERIAYTNGSILHVAILWWKQMRNAYKNSYAWRTKVNLPFSASTN